MTEGSDTRDKVIAQGVELEHVNEKLDKITLRLDEVHEALTQAKGGWKVLLGLAGFVGFLSGLAAWLVPPFFQR